MTTNGGSQRTTMSGSGNGQDVGSPIGNETYNVIAALHEKLEGLEAYRKYSHSSNSDIWKQLSDMDNKAVQLLTSELERLVGSGGLATGRPGQTR